jgi:GNAT superfamily N-acetyltransferase
VAPSLRPLRAGDVDAAAELSFTTLPVPDEFQTPQRLAWSRERIGHFVRDHGGGAWAAEQDGRLVGVGLALVHDGIWGLSLLVVDPERQARGTGRALLAATLGHGPFRGAIICSSQDPKATRIYARAGFDLRPCVSAGGIVDRAAIPAGLEARPSDDVEAAAALARPVRGGAYRPEDVALYARRDGHGLLTIEGRGFAVHHDGSPAVVCATDEGAAADLMWACFAAGPNGGTVHVDYITAGQDWAVRTALDAGLPLSAEGPLFTRGELGPLRPWLPSGALL